VSLGSRPGATVFGLWPNDGNQDVVPYGLDVGQDLGQSSDASDEQLHQYMGVPIHISLPAAESILVNPTDGLPSLIFSFRKLPTDPITGDPQAAPSPNLRKTVQVFGGPKEFTWTIVSAEDNTDFNYGGLASESASLDPYLVRGNEIFLVPTEPLEPNSWYEVGTRIQTVSKVLEDTSDPSGNPYRLYRWQFKTNSRGVQF
jgi:hypothetical protein